MGFQKGNKAGLGRVKGSTNKSTEIAKRTIAKAMELSEDRLMQELNNLDGTEYINAYTKLARFILPTLQSQAIAMEVKNEVPLFNIPYEELSEDINTIDKE